LQIPIRTTIEIITTTVKGWFTDTSGKKLQNPTIKYIMLPMFLNCIKSANGKKFQAVYF